MGACDLFILMEFHAVPKKQTLDKKLLEEVLVFFVLVAIGVAGRWRQPDWCFTPIAAVAVFAGFYFRRFAVAVLVPLALMAISDLALPAYNNQGVMLTVHLAIMLPVLLGLLFKTRSSVPVTALKLVACGLVPATCFFLMSNWAVWQFQSDYEPTLAGLAACYAAAIPFYRAMLAGDVFYMALILGSYAAAITYLRRPLLQSVPARIDRP
jgi:hypothetical protein